MATDKTVSFKDTIISASTIDDFYSRLNSIRTKHSIGTVAIPTTSGFTLPSQIKAVYDTILSTKSAISFLNSITLKTNFSNVSAGDIMIAPTSVSILEQNIGQLENSMCLSYFNSKNAGHTSSTSNTANHVTKFTPNENKITFSAHTASVNHSSKRTTFHESNTKFVHSANHSTHNAPFWKGANRSDSSDATFKPHHFSGGSTSHKGYKGTYGFCPSGTCGCHQVTKKNSNFSGFNKSFCNGKKTANFVHVHTGNFTPNYGSNKVANKSPNHSPVKDVNNTSTFGTVFSSNKVANYAENTLTRVATWGVYKVEGLADL